MACSIPARCFQPCIAAPNSAACMCMAASSLSPNSRGFEQARVDTLKVRDADDVEQVVRAALASEQPLEIVGHGSKRLAGFGGTRAVRTEVTLKVMPRPESERTLVLRGLDDLAANRAMTAALGSPFDVSGAAHVPSSAFRAAGDGLSSLGSRQEAV